MTRSRIYRGCRHFVLRHLALGAHPKTMWSCVGRGGHGLPQGVRALWKKMWTQSQSPGPKYSPHRAALIFLHRNWTQRPCKESIRHYKRMQNKGGEGTGYQMESKSMWVFSPEHQRAGSHPYPSYYGADWQAGGWEFRSVRDLEEKTDRPYLATVVPFLQTTGVLKIS